MEPGGLKEPVAGRMTRGVGLSLFRSCAAVAAALACGVAAKADPIRHPTAVFAGLDKTTGRIINFEVGIEETVQFRTLMITPRVCNTRPQTETPQTTSFVEVDEQLPKPDQRRDATGVAEKPVLRTDGKSEVKRIFSGWMFASSPGLHGVEHPVYDVWLVDCKGGKEAPPPPEPTATPEPAPAAGTVEAKHSGAGKKRNAAAAPNADAQPGAADDPVFDASATGDPGGTAPPRKKKKKPKKPPEPAAGAAPPAPPPAQNGGGLF